MKKPRIMVLTVGLAMGGAERLIVNLSKALSEQFEFVVVSLKGKNGPLKPILEDFGVKVHALGGTGRFDARVIARFNALLRDVQPALIHTHLIRANWIGRCIGRWHRIPVISTIHTTASYLTAWQLIIERCTAGLAQVNVCCSRQLCVEYTKRVRHPFPYYIYNGVDAVVKPPPASLNPYNAVTLCRIDLQQKALLELVEAVRTMDEPEERKFSCDIYGDGPDFEIVRAAIKSSRLEKRMRLKGFVADPQSVLSRYSLFILPSKFEGLPMSILEAISAGLPVVATNVGGVPEIIRDGDTGILMDHCSPDTIAAAIRRILSLADSLPDMIVRAQALVKERFILEKTAREWSRVYHAVLGNPRRRDFSDAIAHV